MVCASTASSRADLLRQALLAESQAVKAEANALFASRDFRNALSRYDDALASCPKYLAFERAVLQSNIAAAHLKLKQWSEAIRAATDALDRLAELDTPAAVQSPSRPCAAERDPEVEGEIVSDGAVQSAPSPSAGARAADVGRIRAKALLRRARARSEAGGWQNLAGAEQDYRALADMPGLAPADLRIVQAQLKALPPRTKAAQEAETAEMWGKLRQLGDGILKPFGLSTQNFQMVRDDRTGGYSINFTQGQGGSPS